MKMTISGVEYISIPEIQLSSCLGCDFYKTDECSIEQRNEIFVDINTAVVEFSTRICRSDKIIWLKSKESTVKQQEQTYTESQIIQALENWTSVDVELFMRDLKKFADPEYDEYIRLRQKFGSVS